MNKQFKQSGSTVGIVILVIGILGIFVLGGIGLYRASGQSQDIQTFDKDIQAIGPILATPAADFPARAIAAWPHKNSEGRAISPWGTLEFSEGSGAERTMRLSVPGTACADVAARLGHRASRITLLNAEDAPTILKDEDAQTPIRFSYDSAGPACSKIGVKTLEVVFKDAATTA